VVPAVSSWDDQAATRETARAAVWSDDGYDDAIAECLAAITVDLPLEHGSSVLDLGCGIGRLTLPLAAANPDVLVVGYDTSPTMLSWARQAAGDTPNVRWVLGGTLPQVRSGFSMLTFQHVDPAGVSGYLEQLGARALRRGGRFRFQFVIGEHHAGHDHRYPLEEMTAMCEAAGLRVENVTPGLLHEQWAWITAVRD
jgi:cyclopropane fatty-acyl-phospholipid synthase-like methyltransferase